MSELPPTLETMESTRRPTPAVDQHPPHGTIVLEPMKQQRGIRTWDDDWSGMTDAVKRRRLQNRMTQRAYRERMKQKRAKTNAEKESGSESPADRSQPGRWTASRRQSAQAAILQDADRKRRIRTNDEGEVARSLAAQGLTISQPTTWVAMQNFAHRAYLEFSLGAPCTSNLLTLIKLNVFRALHRNASILDCSAEWLQCSAISYLCCPGNGPRPSAPQMTNWPETLFPTKLQRTVEHHPWIDLLPTPRLRDNILRATIHPTNPIDEDDLCYDLVEVGFIDGPGDPQLIVWGEPWNPYAWEASLEFLRKWGGLLQGCTEILDATNYWRARRGESKLKFGRIEEIVDHDDEQWGISVESS